jgi:glycosyltransferase involved in cell wall biosynthesis
MKMSAVLITKNEEATIEATLHCLRHFNEVIAVDYSSDGTKEILKAHGAQVIQQKPRQFATEHHTFHPGVAKNYAVRQAQCPYVLCIDGDETVHSDIYGWLQNHTDQLVHIRQVHMKNAQEWLRYGGEAVRAGPRDRMRFSMNWNTNVVETAEVNAPYCILNWGYAEPWSTRVHMRLNDSRGIREGGGTWWEKFGRDNVFGMLNSFAAAQAKPLSELPYILPEDTQKRIMDSGTTHYMVK